MSNPFSKPKVAAPPAAPTEATPMPDEQAIQKSQRRLAASRAQSSGRMSTVLTNQNGNLGGG